jgi:hypothetical protein
MRMLLRDDLPGMLPPTCTNIITSRPFRITSTVRFPLERVNGDFDDRVRWSNAAPEKAAVGRLIGALVEMGIPEFEAKRYEGGVKEGGMAAPANFRTSSALKTAAALSATAGGRL